MLMDVSAYYASGFSNDIEMLGSISSARALIPERFRHVQTAVTYRCVLLQFILHRFGRSREKGRRAYKGFPECLDAIGLNWTEML